MLELEDVPQLRDPLLIAAFEGWNDAGEAATSAVTHLAEVWSAEPIAALDPEDYYDFQVNRPRTISEDGQRRIQWPTTRLLLARDTGFDRDVVLVEGIEPSTRWRSFTIELLEYAEQLGVTTIVTLGALLADVPHTRPIPVTTTAEDDDVKHRFDAEASTYEGPTGIVGVLTDAANRAGITSLTCWAAVPHYAGGPPRPRPRSASSASWRRSSTSPSRSATCPTPPRPGSGASTSSPSPTTRSRSTSSRSRSRPTPPTSPRRAATPSPGSSSATCAAGATTDRPRADPAYGLLVRARGSDPDAEQRVAGTGDEPGGTDLVAALLERRRRPRVDGRQRAG